MTITSKDIDLEGRLVILSGDSQPSRKMADDLFREVTQDHEIGSQPYRLNVRRMVYGNQLLNHKFEDPNGVLSMEQIEQMIANGNVFYVSKLEVPFLEKPLKYLLPNIIKEFGNQFMESRRMNEKLEQFRREFSSYVACRLPQDLRGVSSQKKLEKELWSIAERITDIFLVHEKAIKTAYGDKKKISESEIDKGNLRDLSEHLHGYFMRNDIVLPITAVCHYDELRTMTHRIGRQIQVEGTKGELHLVLPWLDGRSDHNKKNPYESIRMQELVDTLAFHNVKSLKIIRAHSQLQVDYFEKNVLKKIPVTNLTQTNEYISLLGQDLKGGLREVYVLSPDEGGEFDAMVFARELYRRTGGEFNGRVVVFRRERVTYGKIEKMDFIASYLYDSGKEKPEDVFKLGEKPDPYDKKYARTFKDPNSPDFIKRLFNLEFGNENIPKLIDNASDKDKEYYDLAMGDYERKQSEQEALLTKHIKGYVALIRDDASGTASTIVKSGRRAYGTYDSRVCADVEHASLIDNAINDLNKMHQDGILIGFYTSTSIPHPFPGSRVWMKARSMAKRFKGYIKKDYMPWLGANFNEKYERLKKYAIDKVDFGTN